MMKIILFADSNFHYSSNLRVSEPSYSYYSDPSHSSGDLITAEMEHGGLHAAPSKLELAWQAGLRVKTDTTRYITTDSNKRRAHIISHLAEKFNGTTC